MNKWALVFILIAAVVFLIEALSLFRPNPPRNRVRSMINTDLGLFFVVLALIWEFASKYHQLHL